MEVKKSELCFLIGSKLRNIREKKGLTIEHLAFDVGIDSKQLIRIELGQINTSLFQIFRITQAMGLEMYEVFLFSTQ